VRLERAVLLERPRRLEQLARPEVAALKAELLAELMADEAATMPGAIGGEDEGDR
jgi:hypothetical protein